MGDEMKLTGRKALILWIPAALMVVSLISEMIGSRSLVRIAAGLLAIVLVVVLCILTLRMSTRIRAGGYSLLPWAADSLTALGLMAAWIACFGTLHLGPGGIPAYALVPLLVMSGTFLAVGLGLHAIRLAKRRRP